MTNQKGFVPILIVIVVVIVLASGAFFLLRNNKNTQNSVQPQQVQPTSSPSSLVTVGSQTFKDHYGEYQIELPQGWNAEQCIGAGNPGGCAIVTTANVKDNTVLTGQITINAYIPGTWNVPENKNVLIKNFNLNIPALGNGANAVFEKSADKSVVAFLNRGVYYTFEANYDQSSKSGFSTDNIDQILKTIASSITILNEPSTCKDSALLPLTDFPANFSLYNYHDSDGSDPVYSYWPYTNKKEDSKVDVSKNSKRGFMVNYIKDGNPINTSSFSQLVTPIHPSKSASAFDDSGTGLNHLNCIDTQEDAPGNEIPYRISEDDSDLFGVHLYGNAANPQALWGVAKWNIALLKSVRDKVYIKQGSLWQLYQATGYFATMPTAYGGKPAIYLYPPKPTQVKVEIHPQGNIIKTDELYNPAINGWLVQVNPDGNINNSLDYLYYEALLPVPAPKNGYVVSYQNLFNFSRDYVLELGLNQAEASEFIKFWQEKLPKAPYYFVSHLDLDIINSIYPLRINPQPDNLLRVELYFKPLDKMAYPEVPSYPSVEPRRGFTAVEWGGILDK